MIDKTNKKIGSDRWENCVNTFQKWIVVCSERNFIYDR